MVAQAVIKYNTEFHRWEVYSPKSVIRNGELQPVFVSPNRHDCELWIAWAEE